MGYRLHNDDEMGFDLDFIIDPIEDVGSSVIDRVGGVVKAIPGSGWVMQGINTVTGPIGDFVKGPFRDFANTAVGETIIRAFSVAVGTSLAVLPMVGYTLAFLSWSIPGLARGEAFDEALVKEFVYRVEYIASYFGGKAGGEAAKEFKAKVNDMMSSQLKTAIEMISKKAQEAGVSPQQLIAQSGLSPGAIAKQLGIRQDVAAYAIEWFKGNSEAALKRIKEQYGADGSPKATLGKRTGTTMANPCDDLKALQAKGFNENTSNLLMINGTPVATAYLAVKKRCEEFQLNEQLKRAEATKGRTLGKRGGTGQPTGLNPCELYEKAKQLKQGANVIAVLKGKCDAYSAEMAAKQATLAASAAVATAPTATIPAAEASNDSETNKKSAIAGLVSGFVGAGGALLAGLSAGIAIPVGLGFAAGGAIATKVLSKPKAASMGYEVARRISRPESLRHGNTLGRRPQG